MWDMLKNASNQPRKVNLSRRNVSSWGDFCNQQTLGFNQTTLEPTINGDITCGITWHHQERCLHITLHNSESVTCCPLARYDTYIQSSTSKSLDWMKGKIYRNPLYLIWLVVYLPLWKIWVKWEMLIPNWMENHQKFHGSSHHQSNMNGNSISVHTILSQYICHIYLPVKTMVSGEDFPNFHQSNEKDHKKNPTVLEMPWTRCRTQVWHGKWSLE